MDEIVASFIAIALAALLVSYKGPECMASFKLKQEKQAYAFRARVEAQSSKSNSPEAPKEGECPGEK